VANLQLPIERRQLLFYQPGFVKWIHTVKSAPLPPILGDEKKRRGYSPLCPSARPDG
jgi:hypothetical protein